MREEEARAGGVVGETAAASARAIMGRNVCSNKWVPKRRGGQMHHSSNGRPFPIDWNDFMVFLHDLGPEAKSARS